MSTTATRAGAVWASALRVPAVHVAFFNTATRLDGSVLTTPSSPFCFPLLYFLSVRRPYFFSFPSRGVELSELHLLLSLSTLLSCCQIDLSLFKTVTSGMRLGGFNLNYKKKKTQTKTLLGLKHPHAPFPDCLSLPLKSVSRRGGAVLACLVSDAVP